MSTVPLEQLAEHVSEGSNPGSRAGLTPAPGTLPLQTAAELGLSPRRHPGVGGLGSRARGRDDVRAADPPTPSCWSPTPAEEYRPGEIDFLQAAHKLCPNVACVVARPTCTRTGEVLSIPFVVVCLTLAIR
ncbi:hypothetical protein HBB16_05845, partial [Pseudonocardia sp. MCCB 268]|nr:hypothetical protein [Pseudonocardia cytotoxica]